MNDPQPGTSASFLQRTTYLPGFDRSCPPSFATCNCQRRGKHLRCNNSLQDQQDRQVLEDAMKVIYDKESDTLSIIFRSGKVAESDEVRPGLILDYDKAGRLVSLELLDASKQVDGAQSVEFALAGSE